MSGKIYKNIFCENYYFQEVTYIDENTASIKPYTRFENDNYIFVPIRLVNAGQRHDGQKAFKLEYEYSINGNSNVTQSIKTMCKDFYEHILVTKTSEFVWYQNENQLRENVKLGGKRLDYVMSDWLYYDKTTHKLKAKLQTYIYNVKSQKREHEATVECLKYDDEKDVFSPIVEGATFGFGAIITDENGNDILNVFQPNCDYKGKDNTNYSGFQKIVENTKPKIIYDYIEEYYSNDVYTPPYESYARDSKRNTTKYSQKNLHYRLLNTITTINSSTTEKSVEEIIDEALSSKVWITPSEYYSTSNIDNGIPISTDGSGYYKQGDKGKNKPVWFWLNSIMNWATFKIIDENVVLCVWNGKNDWDRFDRIINYIEELSYKTARKSIAEKYYYDCDIFNIGPTILNYPYHGMTTKVSTAYQWSSYDRQSGTTGRVNIINSNKYTEPKKTFEKKMIRLTEDTKFSFHDSNTYQTVKPSKIYLTKNQRRCVFPVGCPMIERLPSGELGLIYFLRLFGVNDYPLITSENIDFMNSICVSFFGDGEDKTIDLWKRKKEVDTSQEYSSSILSMDAETLFEKDRINTNVVRNEFASMKFTIPTEYPTTETVERTYLADRWEK